VPSTNASAESCSDTAAKSLLSLRPLSISSDCKLVILIGALYFGESASYYALACRRDPSQAMPVSQVPRHADILMFSFLLAIVTALPILASAQPAALASASLDACSDAAFAAADPHICTRSSLHELTPVALRWLNCKHASASVPQIECGRNMRECTAAMSNGQWLRLIHFTFLAFDKCVEREEEVAESRMHQVVNKLVHSSRESANSQERIRAYLDALVTESQAVTQSQLLLGDLASRMDSAMHHAAYEARLLETGVNDATKVYAKLAAEHHTAVERLHESISNATRRIREMNAQVQGVHAQFEKTQARAEVRRRWLHTRIIFTATLGIVLLGRFKIDTLTDLAHTFAWGATLATCYLHASTYSGVQTNEGHANSPLLIDIWAWCAVPAFAFLSSTMRLLRSLYALPHLVLTAMIAQDITTLCSRGQRASSRRNHTESTTKSADSTEAMSFQPLSDSNHHRRRAVEDNISQRIASHLPRHAGWQKSDRLDEKAGN
jgi:hypothetical protein